MHVYIVHNRYRPEMFIYKPHVDFLDFPSGIYEFPINGSLQAEKSGAFRV